ncbi:thiamin biosynthesis lipoprotein ApbE [Klebsiella pneumoniae]|uniref:Thiamin biosynthesis lipoprotein ApbE n=1 Tax=Klebsiella pneumoniae TaxID=573 RepID=A0A377TZH3_KLEPN|nr:thiamin biosynthesis lipoprotein ApbE [Klebsiella pneumoniae]
MDMTFFRAALLGACVLLSGCDSATTPATPTATATVLDGKNDGHLLAGQRHWRG